MIERDGRVYRMAHTAHLFDHQIEGACTLAQHDRYILGDEVGTGKTRTAITALQLRCSTRPLVICPAIVREHWRREFGVCGFEGYPVVRSYDEIVRGGEAGIGALVNLGTDALLLDESHYCKNADAKRTRLILNPSKGIAHRVPTFYAISGTPMHRNPLDLWPLFMSTFPTVLMQHGIYDRQTFISKLCVMHGSMFRGNWVERCIAVKNPERLNEILNSVMLRRTVADLGLDVPPVWWQTMRLDCSDAGAVNDTGIRELVAFMDMTDCGLEELIQSPHMATTQRLIGELKAPLVAARLAEELEEDPTMKVVILAHHRSVLHLLRDVLGHFGVSYIDGGAGPLTRGKAIEDFQRDPDVRVFIGQQQACMTGITLTAAHRVVLVEPSWVAVENIQAAARVARIGQESKHCIAQIVTLAGTLDEAVVRQHHKEIAAVNAALAPVHS